MDKIVKRYFQLKQQQKETEQELKELRDEIVGYCREQGTAECVFGPYRVRLVSQLRKEYDDDKLFNALPDLEVWRLLSKPDPGKIAGLVKLGVVTEEALRGTYEEKDVTLLQVDRVK
ncbi:MULTISPECIES: hypothetical protein [Paenibacillus]|uniref:Uncharacterized protein n=1 Tax=Paenibacillus albilobatus TaxID=2716884 RepID=A0A919XHW2_9BACL|nr:MULTISPECIES: hypothetical protein [Paenibacillus]GIO31215.1 hypothetical protein J2TS6_23560 [Paenibacillus albilobatus]